MVPTCCVDDDNILQIDDIGLVPVKGVQGRHVQTCRETLPTLVRLSISANLHLALALSLMASASHEVKIEPK